MYAPTQVKPSPLGGQGLFAAQPIPRATILCFFADGGKIITEAEYIDAIARNDPAVLRTGTRWAGKYFTYGGEPAPSNFINHAFDPNLLAHAGIFIARRDIPSGEELTVDYRYLLDTTDIGTYRDAATNQIIRGFGPRESLLRSTRELLQLLESTDESWEG